MNPESLESKIENNNVTSVDEYRKKLSTIKKVKMPSGAVFKLKRLTPMDYISAGLVDLPNEFFKFIGQVANATLPEAQSEEGKKNYELFDQFMKVSVEKGIVDPPMILRFDKDKIGEHLIFGELELEDQVYIIQVITGRRDPILAE